MACVNTRLPEFKDTAKRLNINSGELELIVHKFINQKGNEDKFPSDDYILQQLHPSTFEASEDQLNLYFKAFHNIPMQFNSIEEFDSKINELQKYYPKEAIKGYKNADGQYTIQIATPKVKGIPMVLDNSMLDSFLRGAQQDNPYHNLFSKLIAAIGKENINIRMKQEAPVGRSGKRSYAEFNPTNNTITFYVDSILKHKENSGADNNLTRRQLFKTLTHELLHQLTVQTINSPVSAAGEQFAKEIKQLYKEVLDYFDGDTTAHYGLFDVNEFVSEAMTNLQFQKELAQIKSSKNPQSKSFWQKLSDAFIDFFKQRFGVDISNTILKDILSTVENFIDYTNELKGQEDLYKESLDYLDIEPLEQSYSELHEALNALRGDRYNPSYKGFLTGRFEKTIGKWRIIVPETFKGTVAEAREIAKEMLASKGATEEMYTLGKDFKSITENGITYTTLTVGFKQDKRGKTQTNDKSITQEITQKKENLTQEDIARQELIEQLKEVRPDLIYKIDNNLIDVDELINNPDLITYADQAGTDLAEGIAESQLAKYESEQQQQKTQQPQEDPFLRRSIKITQQIDNLRESANLTSTEIREIADEIVYWISDFITELQKNKDDILADLQQRGFKIEKLKDEDFANMSRANVVKEFGVVNLLKRAKMQFDPRRNNDNAYYDDINVVLQMEDVMDNFDGIIEYAQPTFLAVEKFSIKYNDQGLAEVNEDLSEAIDAGDFNNTNDSDALKEIEGNEAEHWMIESRTRDLMEDMGKAVENALVQCYILDENGNRIKSKRGIDKRIDRRQATNSIVRWTQGALTLTDMIEKLQDKQKQHFWLSQLIEKLQDDSGQYNDLQSQFFSDFYKPFQLYSVVNYEKGKYKSIPVNEHKALTEATNQVEAQYNTGKHPLFTSNGVNKKTLDNLSKTLNDINEIYNRKDLDWDNDEVKTELAQNIAFAAGNLGYYITEDIVKDSINQSNVNDMKTALSWIIESVTANKDNKSYEPFVFKSKGSIRKNLQNFLSPITEQFEDVAVSAFFDSGKMYQSYITPSYMSKLMQKFKLTGEAFDNFIENEYKKYDWFFDKNMGEEGTWMNTWLEMLATNPSAKEIFAHKTQLNFNKKNYMKDMNDMEYTMSLISEYFAEADRETQNMVPAWFRIPMMSNKPSSEFIRFYSYRGLTYKDNITNGLKQIFDQELKRIQTVNMRNRDKSDFDYITNWDKNGKKFNFLTFMNEYLKDNPNKEKEFSSLLKKKIKGQELSIAEESTLYKEAKRIIKQTMQAKADKILDDWQKKGLVKAVQRITGVGRNTTEAKANLENFIWNDYYAAMNITQLTITDIAYYKNAEDLQKRMAQIHAPGIRGNAEARLYKSFTDKYGGDKVTDGYTRTFYLKDFEDVVSNIIENVEIVFDKRIKEARDRDNETEAKGLEKLKESLVGEEGQFRKINVTDAQGYCSPTAYMKKALIFGKWSQERQNIYDRLKSGEAGYAEIKEAFQPLKPFLYSQIEKQTNTEGAPLQNIKMGVQNKNSEYLLIMADAIIQGENTGRPNLLRAIYDIMEKSHFDKNGNYKTDGIDTVQFASTVKTGLTGAIDINKYLSLKEFLTAENGEDAARRALDTYIYQHDGTNKSNPDRPYSDIFVHKIPIEDYSLQQETPEHFKNHEQQHGSQGRYIIPSELQETDAFGNDILYNVKDIEIGEDGKSRAILDENGNTVTKQVTAKEFKQRYENNIAENIRESIEQLREELHLDGSIRDKNIAISKVLQREILNSPRYGVDLLLACSVDENGKFRIPLGDPIQSKRIEQLLTSIIKNRVNKQKIAGGPVVQVSNFGTSRELNIRFKDKNGGLLMTRAEWKAKLNNETSDLTPKLKGKMTYSYNGNKLNSVTAESTIEAIKRGERTATTRYAKHGNLNYWENANVGDIIEFAGNNGEKVLVRVTKKLHKLDKDTNVEEWTKKEGWSTEHYDKFVKPEVDKGEAYQMEYEYISDIQQHKTYEDYIKNNQGGIAYFEVFAPIYRPELLKFTDGKGNIDIDMIELVQPDLLKMVGYRIPTEAKYSMAPLKIVGFLPREAGEAIMLPNDITLLTGSDFDIDKEYLMRKEYDIAFKYEPKGEITDDMTEAEKDWIKHNRRSIITHLSDTILPDIKLTTKDNAEVKSRMDIASKIIERKHKQNIENIKKRNEQLLEAENIAYSNPDIKTKEEQINKRKNKIEKSLKKALEREETRYKEELQKEREKQKNITKQNKARSIAEQFIKIDRWNPTKTDNALIRVLRKAYLDYSIKVIEPTSGRMFRNNQILDMTYEILSHEQSAAEMLNPGGFEPEKRMGYMVAAFKENSNYTWEQLQNMTTNELKDLCQVDKNLMDIDTHIQFYKQNNAAAALTGIFAVERVAHAVIENEGYKMDVFKACKMLKKEERMPFIVFETIFGGKEEKLKDGRSFISANGVMEIDVRHNSNFESIGKVLGSLVASAVDAVKDPVLNLMNINSNTAKVLTTLIRTGMSFEDAALFLSTQAVTNVLNTFSRENLTSFKTFDQVITKRMKEIEKENGITRNSVIHKEPLSRREIMNSLREEDMTLAAEYKILKNLKRFRGMAEAMRLPTLATRFNSITNAVGPLAIDNLMTEYQVRKLSSESSILNSRGETVTLRDIQEQHPILKEFTRTFAESRKLLQGLPAMSNSFDNFLWSFEGNIEDRKANPIHDKIMRDRQLLSKLSDFYQSYLLIQNGVIDPKELKYYITEFPEEFQTKDYKSKYKDNKLIQAIRYETDKSKRLTLNINLTGVDTADKERIGDGWSDLYKEDPNLAIQLFKYCFFKGGIGFNPKSFMALLPMQMKERIPNYINTFRIFPPVTSFLVFDQFIRNNWDSNKLVPQLDDLTFRELHNGVFDVTTKEKNDQYKLAQTQYFKIKTKVNDQDVYKMYRLVEVRQSQSTQEPPATLFVEIEPLGSNKDYIEISTDRLDKATDTTVQIIEDEYQPGTQETEVMPEPPTIEGYEPPITEDYINPKYEQNANFDEYQDLAFQAFVASPNENVSKNARKTVEEWKNKSENEKKSLARSTKNFFKLMFDKLGIKYDEKLIDKVYESIC